MKHRDGRTVTCACCRRENQLTPKQAAAGVLCEGCCQAFALAAPILLARSDDELRKAYARINGGR